jgi:NDP-sugar pyrophosphorylase family protein
MNNLPDWNVIKDRIKAFILVGGLGTRLKSVVSNVPKPMAPIEGKPFLYYKILQIKKAGIRNIVFCSGYLHEIIEEYFGNGSRFEINIEYSIETELLGTAGAIINASKYIDKEIPFFVLNGDTYLNIRFEQMWRFYTEARAKYLMLLAAHHRKGHEGVVVVNEENKIIQFIEKPDIGFIESLATPYINGGVYLLSSEILNFIPKGRKSSLETEIFPKLVQMREPIYGIEYPSDAYFIDIGVPEIIQNSSKMLKP